MSINKQKIILITGGTGLVGKALAKLLREAGYQLNLLSRTKKANPLYDKVFQWNVEKGTIESEAFDNVDHIIHLAGTGIADERWTPERKQLIIDSRVKSTALIYRTLKNHKGVKPSFISASAIGFYGAITSTKIQQEDNPPADDFLGVSCRLWEEAADQFNDLANRVLKIRIGIVLSREGGALPKLMKPIKLGLGAPVGSGDQHMPWIHINDIASVFLYGVENEKLNGVYNAVAQTHCTNKYITKAIAKKLNRPFWPIPVPSLVLKLIYGEMSKTFLEGSPVDNKKLKKAGFNFKFENLDEALNDLID